MHAPIRRPPSSPTTACHATLRTAGGRPCFDTALLADAIFGVLEHHPATLVVALRTDQLEWVFVSREPPFRVVKRFAAFTSSVAARLGLRGPLWSPSVGLLRVADLDSTCAQLLGTDRCSPWRCDFRRGTADSRQDSRSAQLSGGVARIR